MNRFVFACFLVVSTGFARAEVRLPNLFSDGLLLQRDKLVNIWGWADPGEAVSVNFAGVTKSTRADADGNWMVQLPPQQVSKTPELMTVQGSNEILINNVLVGEVWLCSGQSNMEWPMTRTLHGKEEIANARHPLIRLFNVQGHIRKPEPQNDAPGKWQICNPESVAGFSAVGYHFGQKLHAELDVPIGLIGSNWGGTQIEPWTPKAGLEQVESLKPTAKNGAIYNGMIHPLKPYTMRGIIWYQGESNCLKGDTNIYTDRTEALVKGWRTVFRQDDLSFYFVQIAPFPYASRFRERNDKLTAESLPRFWDAQVACLQRIDNSGMVVVTDITGNVNDIHPPNKRDVGHRLARWALAKNYRQTDLVFSGPRYDDMTADNGTITLRFDHVGDGLQSLDGKPLSHFAVAGADRKFFPAKAEIQGNSVKVRSAEVANPVAARFAWHETAIGNLGNAEGLPAIPFRTDDW